MLVLLSSHDQDRTLEHLFEILKQKAFWISWETWAWA